MEEVNKKLLNEIKYLSSLINTHKSQAVGLRTANRFNIIKNRRKNVQFNTHHINQNVNKSHMNKNCVDNRIFKSHRLKSNPYKIDRTINNNSTRIKTLTNSKQNSNSTIEENRSFFITRKRNVIAPNVNKNASSRYVVLHSSDSSSSQCSSRLKDLVQTAPVLVTIQQQSKRVSLEHSSNKITLSNNVQKELPNISITKNLKHNGIKHNAKSFQISTKKIFENRSDVPTVDRIDKVTLSASQKSLIVKQNLSVIKTKYKVVNSRNNEWKRCLKPKQKKSKVPYRNNSKYTLSPWKMVHKYRWNIPGKYRKSVNWDNAHWKSYYYKKRAIFNTSVRSSVWYKKQPLAYRRKIAQQVKKNPILRSRMVMIGGLLYNASKMKLSRANKISPTKQVARRGRKLQTLLIRGVRYQMDSSRKVLKKMPNQPKGSLTTTPTKNLKRVDLGGDTYVQTKPGVLTKTTSSQARTFVSRVVNRSIYRVLVANQKKSTSKTNLYCMFYNRFGRCNRKDRCPYKHDPDKIAVCTRFLRGTCKVVDCPFSHKVSPDKMPVCSFYLQGRCNNDNCAYRHVKVNRDAEVCKDFLRGYCPLDQKCKKTHILICPDFAIKGSCKNGEKCPMYHKTRMGCKRKYSPIIKSTNISNNTVNKNDCRHPLDSAENEDTDVQPAKKFAEQPSFISLTKYETKNNSSVELPSSGKSSTLRIRPIFLNKGTLGVSLPVSQVSNNMD